MATKLSKPVARETGAFVRDRGLRPLVVTLHDSFLELRPRGLRRGEVIDLAAVFGLAVRARLLREKAERAAAKKAKRKS